MAVAEFILHLYIMHHILIDGMFDAAYGDDQDALMLAIQG